MRDDFDFLLSDLMMPNGGGMALYERLGQERSDMLARMVFMTGGTFTDSATRFLERVPNRRLLKPFSPDELLAIIEGPTA
jgi:DNA-binding response OmpR family regulator